MRLAASEENAAEFARYQRLLTEVEPSDLNQVELVKALLANDEADAALDALAAHVSAIVKVPGAWDELLPLLTQKALTGKAGDLLARELGGEKADPRNRFTLALFQMTAGHLDEAKSAWWDIFSMRLPHAAATAKPSAPPVALPDEAYLVFYGNGGTVAELRLADAVHARSSAQALLDPESAQGGQSLGTTLGAAPAAALAGQPDPLDTTRDAALVYLAAVAVKQNATEPFLAELDRRLAARDSSRQDRLVAYASVDATDPLLREIAAQARAPEPDLDIFCAGQLFSVASGNEQANAAASNGGAPAESPGKLTAAQIDAMGPLAEVLFRRVTLARPETTEVLDVVRIAFYTALGRKAQADEIQRGFLARINEHASATLLSEAVELLLASDLDAGQRAQMRTLARALAIQTNRTHNVNLRQGEMSFPAALLANTETGAVQAAASGLCRVLGGPDGALVSRRSAARPGHARADDDLGGPTPAVGGQRGVKPGRRFAAAAALPPGGHELGHRTGRKPTPAEGERRRRLRAVHGAPRRAGAAGAGSARGAEILSIAGVGLHGLLPGRDRRGAGDRPGAARHASRRPGPASAHGDHPQPQQPDGGRHRAPESGGRGA